MKRYRYEDMKSGWFVGDSEPTAYNANFEVNYRKHKKGEEWDVHYHTEVTEINLLIRGKMKLQGQILQDGDIFILEPYEVADPQFLKDTEIVCVKTPSVNDKVSI